MKSALKYGILTGILVIGCKLIVFFTHSQFTKLGIYSGLISLLLIIVPLSLAIKNRRDKELGGFITLKEAMKTGLFVSAIGGLLNAMFTFFYYQFIDHETLAQLMEQTESFMRKANKPQSEIDIAILSLKEFYAPFRQAIGVLTGVLGTGIVFSIICSTFIVKNPPAATS